MYSKEVEALLKEGGASVGDTIKLVQGEDTFRGVVMPRPEVGDSSILIIKQENGYNVGIKVAKGAKAEKVNVETKSFTFPKAQIKSNPSLPTVAIVYTGGTIGSKVDYTSGGVYTFTKPEELLADVPELNGIANLKIYNPFSILSEDMTYKEWQVIAEQVARAFNEGARGVVITHGTDTMHYSSAVLSFMLEGLNGPVVYTGAQRSSDRGSSDAFINLIAAVRIAASSNIAEVGICMHGSSSDDFCDFNRGTKVRKLHTSRRDAFKPVNNLPIARVSTAGSIEYLSEYREISKEKGKVSAKTGFEPKVALIKVHPNSDPSILDYYVSKGCKGIILEGTGLGHVPTTPGIKELSWIPHIKEASKKGVVIGMTSQTIFGRVSDKVYRNLREVAAAGAIHCEDMMPETAYVKLGWLLANHSTDDSRRLLKSNLVGEITERTETDEFL
ncbi:MAG: Glu-tRNA(Gln) amidotransferase subunit GatD [Candidatus Micrarchaeota archaeon]|nr:Glu-tRNA(Gln) amidotransferase subunit GatD [Candidatus Micrarchaeota archaeon]MDE1804404.1 Glu-tRNA(Gln) amidotransferase subunit GatD [Candidatus Micrarchaeota archaeon]MDE1846928.1 Glu-tRNA(Gln) amidotransferase subunit GatD [Candidatus Micrarchaeota archaeon]